MAAVRDGAEVMHLDGEREVGNMLEKNFFGLCNGIIYF